MFKVLGLLTCSGLVAASVWLVNFTSAQESPFESAGAGAARERSTGAFAPADPFAGATSSPGTSASVGTASDVARRRVDDYLRQAKAALQRGDQDEALRMATAADRMARQWNVTWKANEQTPAQFLAGLRSGEAAPIAVAAESRPAAPGARPQSFPGGRDGAFQLTSGETDAANTARPRPASAAWAAPAASPSADPAKRQADELLRLARASLDQGHYQQARDYALQAGEIEVTYGLFDDQPQYVIADLERRTGLKMIAGAPAPAAAPQTAPHNNAAAQDLLHEARQEFAQGNFEGARARAAQAAELDVAYDLFDDQPELVMQDIRSAENRQALAAAPAAPPESSPAKQHAQKLLSDARQALANHQFELAEQKISQAEQIDVTYDLFDDSPQMVRYDIARLAGGRQPTAALAAAPAGPSREQQQQLAQSLLMQSKAALDAGRLEQARALAEEARQLEVAYDLFEETPDAVLAQIDRAAGPEEQQFAAGQAGRLPGPSSGRSALDLTGDPSRRPAMQRPGTRTADAMVVNSHGLSALDLYNQGVDHLRNGDRQMAYEAFLAAYQTGEKLDGYRQQQLQDKLRELAPRRDVRQASSEQEDLFAPGGRGALDLAAQQQALRFDRLRTEVLNSIFRAERLRDSNPAEAIKVLDGTLAGIEQSGLGAQDVAPLRAAVQNSRSSIEAFQQQRAPLLELERQNAEVKGLIERELTSRVVVEQEIAGLVDEFNKLMDQRRFAEAHLVAQKAKELDGQNPVVMNMVLKSQFAYRDDRNQQLRDAKAETFMNGLDDAEGSLAHNMRDNHPYDLPKGWSDLTKRREKYQDRVDESLKTQEEIRIYKSLTQPVSLHFDEAPLAQVLTHLANQHGINVVGDPDGMQEEGVTEYTPVTINVDGIQLKSALNLILKPLHLDYTIEDEVLKITSRMRQQGEYKSKVYSVTDLVAPLKLRTPEVQFLPGSGYGPGAGYGVPQSSGYSFPQGNGPLNVPPRGGLSQVADPAAGGSMLPTNSALPGVEPALGGGQAEFEDLTELIMTTIDPDGWAEFGGQGYIEKHEGTFSLVIRQTQKVHQEIADLLEQLRRLQDLQITIEDRFITISDSFFEHVGIDFDFNIHDSVGGPPVDNVFDPLQPFGAVDPINGSTGGVGQGAQQGQQGQQQAQAQAGQVGGVGPFSPGPLINLVGRDSWPAQTIVGMSAPGQFSGDLDIPFRQDSFTFSAPSFGGFDPAVGINFGLAVLSDIEAFLFVRAVQGDRRSNIMAAPKVTTFNGLPASISNQTLRPFVISVVPVVSAFAVGFQPIITVIPEGISLSVAAVVSADRRYVRLSVFPLFTTITDVFTFSFVTGGGVGGALQQGAAQAQAQGQAQAQQGQQQQGQQGAGTAITVQQPVVDQVTVTTVVSVPDGGTVLLGGVKQLSESRNMAGVPILNKIPYVSRLFKNTGVGRDASSLMLMVTPRIIIQEEEEELLGIPPQ